MVLTLSRNHVASVPEQLQASRGNLRVVNDAAATFDLGERRLDAEPGPVGPALEMLGIKVGAVNADVR